MNNNVLDTISISREQLHNLTKKARRQAHIDNEIPRFKGKPINPKKGGDYKRQKGKMVVWEIECD
jgi:hypothetical protein